VSDPASQPTAQPESPPTAPSEFSFEAEANDFEAAGVESPTDTSSTSGSPTDRQPSGAAAPAQGETPPAPGALRGDDGRFLPRKHHSPASIQAAKAAGWTDEQISATDPDELRDWLIAASYLQQQTQRSATPPAAQPQQDPLASLGIDREDYDPGIIGVLDHLIGKLNTLEAQAAQTAAEREQAARQTAVEQATRDFDAAFAELGPAYESVIGKGTVGQIARDSDEYFRRWAVTVLSEAMGTDPASRRDRAKYIAQRLFGKPGRTAANGYTLEQWMQGGLARPSSRNGSGEPTGVAKARKTVATYLRDAGFETDTTADDFRLE
jgi:hypothetical protein